MHAVRRHDLFTVAPDAWSDLLAGHPDLDGVPHLGEWARKGRPVIARRRHPGEASDHLPAGLPLPPASGQRRIALAVPWPAATPRPAVTLAEARAAAPAAWHPALDGVLDLSARWGLVPRVFGSLLWQRLTGLDYLTAGSDLDLLWPAAADRRFLDGLAGIEAGAPMRLDGEVVLPDGTGINWRELRDAAPDGSVLAKGLDAMALIPAASVLSSA
ncbi:malonate decarboxylase holo-[acyl-carrier-protein] synthase [uncultured Methylobacterium sp.]|uniref:malonate decarboxylase holo-[acyl-carrier-protein] synthase n=1 Tax=uncultured Methylobacterium sp. TaxID=157278 RepID=UPI0035CC6F0B